MEGQIASFMDRLFKNSRNYFDFLGYAWQGIRYAVHYHTSFRIQMFVGLLAVGLGLWLQISRIEWLLLLVVIFTVLAAELLNTAVETTLDYMTEEHHFDVKVAKDIAAGGVLLTAIGAILIGVIIFLPHLVRRLSG